ncbi:AAA family ATPase [Pseudomonas sp. zfem005]|uniref:AAA family ATPase n=1 Tax=Pseudomonas sp. zfem005 TaxID=3078200 RepID=UPI002928C311|nr:AAA family ATPase [Pseudomonas sp. zfem005]MDU9416269.1 AAA family ATPase [Pseudomonas sp. zfem005]
MLSRISRYMPLLFAIMVFTMLYQFIENHWPQPQAIASLISSIHAIAWYLASAALFGWLFLLLGWLHFHERLPDFLKARPLMDILDRLTNKQVIEEGLEKQETAIFIDAESLAEALKQRVIGQNAVCEDISAQIRRRLALSQRGKPVGVFLLAGPPGTGKTLLAKVLAKELERPLLHLDMTQFAAGSHSLSQLLGMNKGYVGSDTYGKLTSGLQDNPNAVVLLDEIEKAHPDVLKAFLTAWNDGFITERSDSNQVSTTSAIFILTSNAGTKRLGEISTQYADDPDALREAAVNALREASFAPEVLNRLDRIFVFQPFKGLDIARVAALEIEEMIRGYGLDVADRGIDPNIILLLMRRYQKLGKLGSSRDLIRAIEEQLADSLITAKKAGLPKVELFLDADQRITARAMLPHGSRS